MYLKINLFAFLIGVIILGLIGSCQSVNNNDYQGKPFVDANYQAGPQNIPGKLQCELYDMGGEGIAYHDTDSVNNGSGRLNPANGTYLNEFRMNEGVDISYTKTGLIDDNPYNTVEPKMDQFYVGWTAPGEWVKYTVNVEKSGTYQLSVMYTSNQDGKIEVSTDDDKSTGPFLIPSTFVAADTIAWRQWHHWNYIDKAARLDLKKGLQIITLYTVEIGQMNYDFIDFELVK
jgi:hypothetical protein